MPLCGGFIRGTSRPKTSRDARGYELMKRRQQGAVGTADLQVLRGTALNPAPMATGTANRQRRPSIRRESCGFADLGRSNLWRPMVVDRNASWGIRACFPQAKNLEALIYGRQIRAASAAASGSRQRRLPIRREFCGFAEFGNFNLWFPNSSTEPAAASGSRHCRPG